MALTKSSGGYVVTKTPLIRSGFNAHSAATDMPVSPLSLRALNAIQATPWRINGWVLDVISKAYADGLPIAGIETGAPPALPPRMPDEVWASLEAADRKDHSDRLRDIHAKRASINGKRQALLDKLLVASEMRDYPAIWYPHTLDWRGRVYPLPVSGPHPQSDDVGKALLMFAEGLPLGPDGLDWLMIRAANAYGQDKLPLAERVQWAWDHYQAIYDAAADPLGTTFWTAAEEPWSFLATCHELAQAVAMEEPWEFVSHLPVPLDGSCNGLQHLSAMGLDPVGATATNLAPGPRQDIYEEVAAHVRARVEADAATGVREALHWHGKVTRKVCKRSVMTTPYGVTDSGIRRQLLQDNLVDAQGDDQGPAATYLRDRLVEALGATISAGKGIMAWLQQTAQRLGDAGLPFDWETPTGSRCRQAYFATARHRIQTLVGVLELASEHQGATLLPRKQALGSAPNLVHSFDAAHLSMTVTSASERGMDAFAMIHDSFGVHASHTAELSKILREQFVAIYRTDWLAAIYQQIRTEHPHVAIERPPERGPFDIAQVLDAPFFFS